ncbi:hypothetical protein MTO96_002138 [Rhipicephalus appendiculatus]
MESIPPERELQVSLAAFAERGDTSAIADDIDFGLYRPLCSSSNDGVCQIKHCLPYCNKLLFNIGLELREQRGGSLSLVTIPVHLGASCPGPELHRATPFLRWILKTHVCITAFELWDSPSRPHGQIVLQELPENSGIQEANTAHFRRRRQPAHPHHEAPSQASQPGGAELLWYVPVRGNCERHIGAFENYGKCLTSLVLKSSFGFDQPPKTLFDALAANSTLKWLDLVAYWKTAKPPGPLGEYVRSNGFLPSLTVSGLDVDREKLLLDKVLVRNDTLCRLHVSNLFGGGRSVRFITKVLAECSALRKLYVGSVRTAYTKISEATLTRCADALERNQTLEELTLPYGLWRPNNWIAFFELLPKNKQLKKLDVTHRFPQDYLTLQPVLGALALTKQSAQVSFGHYVHGIGVDFLHFEVFSSVELSGDESAQVDALQLLPAYDHVTSLSVDVFETRELMFSALAKYIRETTLLRKLRLTVTNPEDPEKTAASTCWALLFQSMSVNTSISDLDVSTNGAFRYNDCLTRIIGHNRYISRVSFLENTGFGNATEFVSLLSKTIGDNYALLEVDLHGAKVGVDAKWCLFAIREATRRNCGLVERAAAFDQTGPLDRYTASAFETVARSPALLRELAQKTGVAAAEVAERLQSRLEGAAECKLHDLSDECWRLVRSYLSFDDVKPYHFMPS